LTEMTLVSGDYPGLNVETPSRAASMSSSEINGAISSAIFGRMESRSRKRLTFREVKNRCYPAVRTVV